MVKVKHCYNSLEVLHDVLSVNILGNPLYHHSVSGLERVRGEELEGVDIRTRIGICMHPYKLSTV